MRNVSLKSGERQVAPTLEGVEQWHKWRYEQAAVLVKGKKVIDLGCGCGYGTWILAQAAEVVVGVDDSQEAIDYALKHYNAENIHYICQDALEANDPLFLDYDWVVAFEIIEHIKDNATIWRRINYLAPQVVLSVPDKSIKVSVSHFHHRHFTPAEVKENLRRINFKVVSLSQPRFKNGLAVYCVAEAKGAEE